MKNLSLNNIYDWPLTTRGLIIGLICAVVIYCGYLWDLSALKERLITVQQDEQNIKQNLELVIKKQVSLKEEISRLSQSQDMLNQWQKKLIHYSELPNVLNEILKVGASNHLHFSLFNPGAEILSDDYFKVPIKVIAVGSYHQLADFISQVANMPWIIVISNFSITNEVKTDVLGAKLATQAEAENLLTAEINLDIYHLVEKGSEQEAEIIKAKQEAKEEKLKAAAKAGAQAAPAAGAEAAHGIQK